MLNIPCGFNDDDDDVDVIVVNYDVLHDFESRDVAKKNLSKCSGTNRAEVEIPLWHLPSRVHLGVIISIINIPNLTSIPSRVHLVGIIGYLSNF